GGRQVGVRPGGRRGPGPALIGLLLRDCEMTTTTTPFKVRETRPGIEAVFAGLLAEVLRVDRVSVDSHFFVELGADSLVMAHFCARVRKRGGLPFLVVGTVPIAAKWLLVGRWKPGQIRIWSLAYVRFWIVKTLIRSNPGVYLFVGSPLYGFYLRALGAKVGPRAVILSRYIPV